MKNALKAWIWSLGVVARSYRTVVLLSIFTAVWSFAGYKWLGLAESSALLLILALFWALLQIIATLVVAGGIARGALETARASASVFRARLIWTKGRRGVGTTLLGAFFVLILFWSLNTVFYWINSHSVEVASFLTFHARKPVSHIVLEEIYAVIEGFLWIALAGFVVGFFMAVLLDGWRGAIKRAGSLFAACIFGAGLLTSLLSAVVFGGLAYKLANWRPVVTPGVADYAQMMGRLSLALILICAGVLFVFLAFARMQSTARESN
jgi:hypothetical protein